MISIEFGTSLNLRPKGIISSTLGHPHSRHYFSNSKEKRQSGPPISKDEGNKGGPHYSLTSIERWGMLKKMGFFFSNDIFLGPWNFETQAT